MHVFALDATRPFGEAVAAALGHELSAIEERAFEDGEHKARPMVGVRGADAYVIQSLHGGPNESPNDKLVRLLFFLSALKTNGAARTTAVIPYLAYARKDRQTKPRDPVTTRTVAQLFEAVGVDRVMTMEVHNIVAFQNAFRCETIHLDTRSVFLDRAAELAAGCERLVVASPDPGGVKRAQLFREALEARLSRPVGSALMEKRRSAGVVSGSLLVGDVEGARVIVVDDLIASGGTIVRAAHACREQGAADVHAFVAHGLFTGDPMKSLADPDLAGFHVTDTVSAFRLPEDFARRHVDVVSAAPVFATAIRRLHDDAALDDLAGPME